MKLRLITVPAAFAVLALAVPASGHDFWLQPMRFQVAPKAPLGATFLIGHAEFRDRWNNNDRIIQLNDIFGGKTVNLLGSLRTGFPVDFITQFDTPGLHVLGMQSNYAFSDLPAIRFNDYAKAEGLALVLATRAKRGTTNGSGRERYSRRAKSLIQVGAQSAANSAMATRAIGLKLEIVPERNPYALDASRMMPLHVLYNGQRLANATVKLTDLAHDAKPVAVAVTDRAGRASLRIPTTGNWLVNVIWSEPLPNNSQADFDTTFSSLTFGYPSR